MLRLSVASLFFLNLDHSLCNVGSINELSKVSGGIAQTVAFFVVCHDNCTGFRNHRFVMYTSLLINDLRDFNTNFEKRNSMKTQNGENIMDQTDSDTNSVVDDDSNAPCSSLAEEYRTVQEIVETWFKSNLIQTLIILVAIIILVFRLLPRKKNQILQRMGDHRSSPTDEPVTTAEEVMDLPTVRDQSLSTELCELRKPITSVRGDFSARCGYVSFVKLSDSGLLKDISEKTFLNVKLPLSRTLSTEGFAVAPKPMPGNTASGDCSALLWQAQDYRPQPYDLTVRVRREKKTKIHGYPS